MAMLESEERARIKRVKAEQAVNLAMQSRWTEAAELNRQIIDAYPKDVEAHNRLGKALMELQKYDEAREVYNHALRLDPTNGIAHKNLLRLEKLMEESVAPGAPSAPVDPSLFIAETGRTTTTALVQLAAPEVLAKMDSGDPVDLRVEGNTLLPVSTAGDEGSLKIIIRETHRDPSMGNRPSFPTTGEAFRGYVRDTLLRYELDEEDDDDDEMDESDHEPEHEADVAAHDVDLADVHAMAQDDDEDDS